MAEPKEITFGLRVPADLAAFILKEAEEQGRSRNGQITYMLQEQQLLIRATRGGVESDVEPATDAESAVRNAAPAS